MTSSVTDTFASGSPAIASWFLISASSSAADLSSTGMRIRLSRAYATIESDTFSRIGRTALVAW